MAESSPLLYLPPLLSIDWLILSSVDTHKITGISDITFKSLIPFTTALDTNSKCLVSPWIIHPIAITASIFLLIRFLHAKINSKLPGTLILEMFFSLTPFFASIFLAPLNSFSVISLCHSETTHAIFNLSGFNTSKSC